MPLFSSRKDLKIIGAKLGYLKSVWFWFYIETFRKYFQKTPNPIPTTFSFKLLWRAQWKYLNNHLRQLFLTTILKRELIQPFLWAHAQFSVLYSSPVWTSGQQGSYSQTFLWTPTKQVHLLRLLHGDLTADVSGWEVTNLGFNQFSVFSDKQRGQ